VPNFSRFLKKAFFSGEALFNFWKSIMKVVIIGIIAYINIRLEIGTIIKFVNAPYQYSFISIAGIAFRILIESALAMLLLSLPDYLFQKRQHRESLKMTKQEVKEERKTMEGDPLIRSRMRERMRNLLNQNMLRNVPEADVVVTNPTHFAVGLEWKQERMNAPTVIAKGQDNMALRIREIARENEVPVIENKPLARALYAEVEIGDEIPERYYEVMALVISEVYRMKGRERVS
jgi:flagellar biosynthetic protein FlhB